MKLVFPGITELQDYTHFGRLQSQIMNIRLGDYVHCTPEIVTCFFLGLRDYVRCNPEVETCNPRDYGITGLHILAALNLKL